MPKKMWLGALLALPLVAAGLAFGRSPAAAGPVQESAGYVCPLNGDELPCRACCPLGE